MRRPRRGEPEARPPLGRRVRTAVLGVLGWVLTALGVIAIVVLIGGDAGWQPRAGRVLVAVAVGLGALLPVALGVAYVVVRQGNRATEATGGQRTVSSRARTAEVTLASILDRVDTPSTELRRLVLTDRVRLTATTLGELTNPWDAIGFIWFVRPSQPDDFPRSPEFRGLPSWTQDAVVLLDLRRELQLRGAVSALSDTPGFYRHTPDRVSQAVARTGSRGLSEAWRSAEESIGNGAPDVTRRLLGWLDDPETWRTLLDART